MRQAAWVVQGIVIAACTAPLHAEPDTPEQCSSIADDVRRLACYDANFRKAAPAESAAESKPAAAEAGQPLPVETPVATRERAVRELQSDWFAITPYRTNYFLPATWRRNPNFDVYRSLPNSEAAGLEDTEAKFQFSVQTLLWPEIGGSRVNLWGAFTLQSYWQVFANDVSSPFRETDYEPELIAVLPIQQVGIGGLRIRDVALSLNHQSNGRTEPLSRSWNRIVGRLSFEKGNWGGYAKLWWRIPEDPEDDDNPHIEHYMGQGEFGLAWKWGVHTFAGILKNNLRAHNKSGLQLDWSFPLFAHLKGYVQGYTGYGENLIDGPYYSNRIGLGVMLTDWF